MCNDDDEDESDWEKAEAASLRALISKDEEASSLVLYLDGFHEPDKHSSKVVAIVRDQLGKERSVPLKQHRRDTTTHFWRRLRALIEYLPEGEQIIALRRVEVLDYFVRDVPAVALKKRIAANRRRDRRHWGKKG